MKKVVKRIGITLGSLVVLIILTLIIVPFFFDIQKYKTGIEQEVTKATGRTFSIGGDLKLSLFPLAGIAFSDVHMGNPDGFTEKDFISIKSFDVKVKLLPLLKKDIQVKRFVMAGPRIVLEKTKDGKAGWQGLGKKESAVVPETKESSSLPIKGLTVAEFSIKNGELLYIDHASESRKEIKDLNIEVNDFSMDQPLKFVASASYDGKPISIEGEAGPIGKEPGKGTMVVNLAVTAMNMLSMTLKGSVTDIVNKPRFDLALSTENFSPRDLMKGLKTDLNIKTKDPDVLKTMSARMKIKGTTENIEIQDGTIKLDQSEMTFSATAKDFSKPDLSFNMNLDKLDTDRYLPPAEEKKPEKTPKSKTKTDYAPLRKIILDSEATIGELVIKGIKIKDIHAKIKGQKGVFNLDPVSLNAYEGNVTSASILDFRGDVPATQTKIDTRGVQVRKLISDFMKKDILEGKATASINLSMSGDNAALIKKTLDGKGEIQLKDGAIVGIDLSGMINNLKSAFGKAQPGEDKGRTDFSEFIIPFEINDGVINTQNTSLVSNIIKVKAKGNADLTKESLDFRIEPTYVSRKSDYTVPVLVTGSFADPKFSPDLNGLLKKSLEKGIDKFLEGKTGDDNGKSESTKDAVKGLLKGILGN